VNRRIIMFVGVVLGVMAMVFFAAWPVWKALKFKAVSTAMYERTKAAVDANPRLKPAWDIAMEDGVLTWSEARVILEAAGQKAEPEQ